MKPSIASISMIRNECDIVELFIKINSRVIDFFYIIDHLSNDKTHEIIKRLQLQGYRINYRFSSEPRFEQADVITRLAREVALQNNFDYIIPLDADEFVASNDPKKTVGEIISKLPKNSAAHIPWVTYCPLSSKFYELEAPLYENFLMRLNEPIKYTKIVLGNDFAKSCEIFGGNHSARNAQGQMLTTLPLVMQHVPVRSPEQIINKAILGSHTLNLRIHNGGFAGQWFDMAKIIREKNYMLNDSDLTFLAVFYGANYKNLPEAKLIKNSLPIGTPEDKIIFKDLARIVSIRSFDNYIADLVAQIQSNQL